MKKLKLNVKGERPDMDAGITEEEFKDDVMNALFGNKRQAFEQKREASRQKKKRKTPTKT